MNDLSSKFLSESRWARREEIESSCTRVNLEDYYYPGAGVPVLCDAKTAYVDSSDSHSVIFGATGSKKTRLFCFPMINMMIRAGESFIATDPKGELYKRTAQAAKDNGYKTVVLNFRDVGVGDSWNPLEEPYRLYHSGKKEEAMSLLNDFLAAISESNRKTATDLFWIDMAASLGLANLLLLMECGSPEEVHPASFANMCSMSSTETLKKIAERIDERTVAGLNYKGVFSSAEKTMQSIQVSLFAWVRIFTMQKKLMKMLSRCSFDLRDIGREKTAVYIIVPDEKTTYHFLVTTFLKQVYETLINVAQETVRGTLPVRVNFVLDEFCNLPAIPDMSSMISAARSRNMRYFLVVQGMRQMTAKYGEDAETIKGNCGNWIFLTSRELVLLNEISELCGTIVTNNNTVRKLISPSELQRLDKEKGETLILFGRKYPFMTQMPDIDEYQMYKNKPVTDIEVKCPDRITLFAPYSVYRLLRVDPSYVLFKDELE